MYLSYADYQTYGGTLDETTFNELEFEAEAQIDWYTFNRLQHEEYSALPEKVKRCMNIIIKMIQTRQEMLNIPSTDESSSSNTQAGILSQSNDGVSISYNVLSASDVIKRMPKEIRSCIQMYLQGVINSLGQKVLYRGIYPNE